MAGPLERSLGILEYLAARPEGAPLATISDDLQIPRSACHRLLGELAGFGYVRQARERGDYALSIKLAALGLNFLSGSGVVDIAQPLIDRLAETSGELVRLAMVDGDKLTWVARAQGARHGLRYDPDMGSSARLSCSASGHAWMLTLSDERAIELVTRQGFGEPKDYGPNAPTTIRALTKMLEDARKRRFSMISESFAPGMTAMAAPVIRRGETALGVISIAGPLIRLNEKRMLALGPDLLAAATELAVASSTSPMFRKQPKLGTREGS